MYRPMRKFGLVNRVLTIKIEKMNKNLNVLDLMQVKGGKSIPRSPMKALKLQENN